MNDLWTIEEALWLEGNDAYRSHMADECLMLFGSMGILEGAEIIATLENAPRWASVDMNDRHMAVNGQTTVIAYQAVGRREGADPYQALCSSTYVRQDGGWKIVQHQQTPL
jgi:hypothetical protein